MAKPPPPPPPRRRSVVAQLCDVLHGRSILYPAGVCACGGRNLPFIFFRLFRTALRRSSKIGFPVQFESSCSDLFWNLSTGTHAPRSSPPHTQEDFSRRIPRETRSGQLPRRQDYQPTIIIV